MGSEIVSSPNSAKKAWAVEGEIEFNTNTAFDEGPGGDSKAMGFWLQPTRINPVRLSPTMIRRMKKGGKDRPSVIRLCFIVQTHLLSNEDESIGCIKPSTSPLPG